ncbi:MAG TPA: hypothetical protein VGQ82_03575 [Chthoniobacterales bacterium]|nr:hypothetical protein [Chthoniobacterales bacterium]
MIRNRIAAFACALLWGSLLAGTAASEWQACSDPRFQFVLKYPPGLVHSRDPGTSACSFKTPDAEFSVEAVLQPDAADSGDTLEARYQKELDLLGNTVTYKRKAETWFVLSGVGRRMERSSIANNIPRVRSGSRSASPTRTRATKDILRG